ncbi:50S ribosomal protein L24 [Gloeothece verrucosa]|uniref:Large ribosomal subunit protein uL24 n=1 Tax=Gloeothece verrucosa (strain PCC 7822) TaxID=497965 RepID=E0UJC2_GLOV7|nr:50S ribosomal protein L24 [Gloeothece verrucosa]ADN16940.1 ribosomal protein L24 [Gloeothece verrucosa PCC 7822]
MVKAFKKKKIADNAGTMHVKKGDTVQVISGRDKGKVGEVIKALPKLSKVIVQGVNVRTKHVKPTQEGESGQISTFEAPIHSSNVMLYSTKEKVASRIGYTFTEDGRKVRMLKKTGEIIDQ